MADLEPRCLAELQEVVGRAPQRLDLSWPDLPPASQSRPGGWMRLLERRPSTASERSLFLPDLQTEINLCRGVHYSVCVEEQRRVFTSAC